MPSHHRYNYILGHTPPSIHPYLHKVMYNPAGLMGPPKIVEGLRNARWMGEWKIPNLTPPNYKSLFSNNGNGNQVLASPAILMLHIFSTPTEGSRKRRMLIRELGLMEAVPEEYRHLVEIKFVLGINSEAKEGEDEDKHRIGLEEEKEIDTEMKMYGDLIRLRLLENGENMNNGKSWEWLRYVGREGGRKAWWVMKCDDDTLPILPNLIPTLLSLDPHKPSYIGTALGRWTGYHYYFQGMIYGFSWGVVKTMAVAEVPRSTRNSQFDEDAKMGELMFSLPLSPSADPTSKYCCPPSDPNPIWSLPPPNPDPCTGLVRYDMSSKIGKWNGLFIDDERSALAWHELKGDDEYRHAYQKAREGFERARREYTWMVPGAFSSVAEV
ncbi:hypothetical protein I302_103844 [Kwoniella bestiolae CBS 10118]|uniref:Hexosyltransferase n=1 Tax=Kwoniella bestiolae CBS 10118 TaxID=1296100 RepID=A0A1B9G9I8_9TREE|nr:hypothetical protein I302_02547 [Kwoniella bestiolae CBS 10118]OCF27702.1 hypothetical protein I302_02547 [Kwoniella bestiolae CBS 10118]